MVDTGKGGGLFGGGAKGLKPEGPSVAFLSDEIINISTRLRVLEERSSNVKKKQRLVEQNMISNRKKYSDEIEILKEEIDEMKRTMREVENKIILIIKEIRMTAKKEDVDSLKKYVELWEPVKFVTQNQVESIVREFMEEGPGEQQ